MFARMIRIAALTVVLATAVVCERAAEGEYLAEEIPPCTPVANSDVDPCEPGAVLPAPSAGLLLARSHGGIGSHSPPLGTTPRTIRSMIDGTVQPFVTHVVIRGTYLPGTVRCTSDHPFRPHPYEDLDDFGGVLSDSLSFRCYMDVRVNAYLVGTGPGTLTVSHHAGIYWSGWFAENPMGLTEAAMIERARAGHEALLTRGEFDRLHYDDTGEVRFFGGLGGREVVLFLGPPTNLVFQTLEVMGTWDVQRDGDGMVRVIHPDIERWKGTDGYATQRAALELTVPAFTQAVREADRSRVAEYDGRTGSDENLPRLVQDANNLRAFLTAVGAYEHEDGPPVTPPPPYGLTVPDPAADTGLTEDCIVLLAARDTLQGTASLNWDLDTSMAEWDGVVIGETPSRVIKLWMEDRDLAGSSHACAVRADGAVAGCSWDLEGQATPPDGEFTSVSAGHDDTYGAI